MKETQKKIVKGLPEISGRELEKLKDFDAILDKHNEITSGRQNFFKGTLWIVALLALTFSVYHGYQLFQNDAKSVVELKRNGSDLPVDADVDLKTVRQQPVQTEGLIADTEDKSRKEIAESNSKPGNPSSTKSTKRNAGKIESEVGEQIVSEVKAYKHQRARPTIGFEKLYEYLEKDLKYPDLHLADSIEGIVTISFVVDTTGAITNIEVLQSLGSEFDLEAIRSVQNMPSWLPATVNEKPIASKLSIPLRFEIDDEI